MIVDPKKLERVRDVVDASVVEQAILHGVSRSVATCFVAQALGHRVRCVMVGERWIAYAVPETTWRRATELAGRGQCIQAAGTEILERLPWHYESDRLDEALLALVCRLLDSGVDLAKSVPAGERCETPMSRWFQTVREQWMNFATGGPAPGNPPDSGDARSQAMTRKH